MAAVAAEQITKVVNTPEGALQLLHPISLSVTQGESLAVTGASGSGKSTLLGLLAGLDTPSSGRILLAGKDITAMDEEGRAAVRATSVGFVFQSFQLLPGLTALENVLLPLELKNQPDGEKAARDFLGSVGLGHRLSHYPSQLSGGEQQRVAIARAFAVKPKVLFADEPTGNLDSHTGEKIIDLIFGLNREQGTTLVLITHEHRLAESCDHRVILNSGSLV